MDSAPGAAGAAAKQIDANDQAQRRSDQQYEVPAAAVAQLETSETWRLDNNAGGEAALGFVFAAEIDDDEMQGQRAHRKVKPAQTQRGQAEHEAEKHAAHRGSRQRDPERCIDLARQDSRGER